MKVDDKSTHQYLKQLRDKQKNTILTREQEIDNIEKLYDKKKQQVRVEGQKQVYDIMDRNEQELVQAVNDRDQKLQNLKTNLKGYEEKLLAERKNLGTQHKEKVENIDQYYALKVSDHYHKGEEQTKDINEQVNQAIKDLNEESQQNITATNHANKLKYEKAVTLANAQLSDKQREFKIKSNSQLLDNSKKLAQMQMEHEKEISKVTLANAMEKGEKMKAQQAQLKNQEEQHKALLKGKQTSFQQKYESLEKMHKSVVAMMKERFDKELTSLKESFAQAKKHISDRGDDQFYKVSKMKPQVKETIDSYIVSMNIPEHEMDKVILTAHDRNIKLTLSRRFEGRIDESQTGEVFKTKRSELFVKEFPIEHIVTDKGLTKNYQDGVLSFKVPKA